MPYPEHYLLQWGGDFVSDPAEIWSNNIRFCTSGAEGGASLPAMTSGQQDAAAAGCLTVLQTHIVAVNSRYSNNTRLKYAKFNRISAEGLYEDSSATHAAYSTAPGVIGTGESSHPLTAAIVVTWLTARARGPASRGRIFVAHPAVTLGAPTFRMSSGVCNGTATQYMTFLNSLNSAVTAAGGSGGLTACVVSAVGDGRSQKITTVQVGDFLDYMGSRRNNLAESRYQSAAVT